MRTSLPLFFASLGIIMCSGCMFMTGLPLLSTDAAARSTAASGAVATGQPLETRRLAKAEAMKYTRVAVPVPDLTKVSWESGAPISPGTPEHCIQSFFDALVSDNEEAMLGCLGTGDQFASARQNVLALVQLYKFRKQSGAKIDPRLIATRLAQSEFAVVDSELLVTQLGETNSMKYAFVCRISNDEWKIFSCGATESAEQSCRTNVGIIDNMIKVALLSGKVFPTSVVDLFDGKGHLEPKCPFAGGLPYILEQDPQRLIYAIHCPCAGLFPSHVLPVEENRMGVAP